MTQTFRVVFKFNKEDGISERQHKILIGEFAKNYQRYCDKVNGDNGKIEQLNQEWMKTHGEEDFGSDDYTKFMADGLQDICDDINASFLGRFNQLEYHVGEVDINFYGKLKRDPSVTLEFFLVPEE